MKTRIFLLSIAGLAATANFGFSQTFQRTATMRGGGNGSQGKCTIEVVVDGAAQVEVRGTSASLINLKGQPPQWRRFECNSPLPANPAGFRFAGVDGRGRQTLIREPRGGSPAVVEINDPDNGTEGYTFDLIWDQQGNYSGDRGPGDRGQGGYPVPGVSEPIRPCRSVRTASGSRSQIATARMTFAFARPASTIIPGAATGS